jgi:putative flippase GtrA
MRRAVSLTELVAPLWSDRRRLAYWWVVGGAFTLLNIPVLYLLVEVLATSLPVATLIAGEAGLLARFLVNDRWVFGRRRPTWGRLWQVPPGLLSADLSFGGASPIS